VGQIDCEIAGFQGNKGSIIGTCSIMPHGQKQYGFKQLLLGIGIGAGIFGAGAGISGLFSKIAALF